MIEKETERALQPLSAPWFATRAGRVFINGGLLIGYLVAVFALFQLGSLILLNSSTALCTNDFGSVFLPSARYIVAGQPLDVYSVRVGANPAYPNANGPLGEFIIAAILWGGRLFGIQHIGPVCPPLSQYPLPEDSVSLRIWFTLVFAIVPIGIGYEILRFTDRYRAKPFTGWMRYAIWLLILISPPLWDSLIFYGHYEQALEIWFGLLSVRFLGERQMLLSGVFLGCALLNRTAGIFIAIPMGLLLLRDWRWRDIIAFGGAFGGTMLAGLLPFLLFRREDTLYSLSSFRALLPIQDGSFWTFVRGTPLETPLQPWDSAIGISLAIILCSIMLWRGRMQANDPAFYAVVCISTVCFALTIKATWGYYFAEPPVWGLVWILATRTSRQHLWTYFAIPVFFTIMLLLTEGRISISSDNGWNLSSSYRGWVLLMSGITAESLVVFIVIVVAIVGWPDLLRRLHLMPPIVPELPPAL
jgi:hypothetical protein